MKRSLVFLAAAMAAGLAYAAEYPDISVADLKAAIESGKVALLDANGTASWKEGRVPGAIDFASNVATLAQRLPKEKDALVVAYCGGPKCMAYKAAAAAAAKLGYTNVKHLSAGISGWKAAGEKVEKGE